MPAHYIGTPKVEFLPGGRDVRLLDGFAFVDAAELRWDVLPDATVDGE